MAENTKKFNGETYRLFSRDYMSRLAANKSADKLRNRGKKARVIVYKVGLPGAKRNRFAVFTKG